VEEEAGMGRLDKHGSLKVCHIKDNGSIWVYAKPLHKVAQQWQPRGIVQPLDTGCCAADILLQLWGRMGILTALALTHNCF
jgi:hypothetical protein